MQREIQITSDGSHTIAIPALQVTYHSRYGAIQESRHVYIKAGLEYILAQENLNNETVQVFEMGFGTGLNALLTLEEALQLKQKITYYAVEQNPITQEEALQLNYTIQLNKSSLQPCFTSLHSCAWEMDVAIDPLFTLYKTRRSLINLFNHPFPNASFHLVYYDAFDPTVQPELWTHATFAKLYASLKTGGVLVTYCSKSGVRKAMLDAGFTVEKVEGPPHKREIVRAKKLIER